MEFWNANLPVIMLLLTGIGTILLVTAPVVVWTGAYPPPFQKVKANRIWWVFLLLLGDTMVLHFGNPQLLNMLIEWATKKFGG